MLHDDDGISANVIDGNIFWRRRVAPGGSGGGGGELCFGVFFDGILSGAAADGTGYSGSWGAEARGRGTRGGCRGGGVLC